MTVALTLAFVTACWLTAEVLRWVFTSPTSPLGPRPLRGKP